MTLFVEASQTAEQDAFNAAALAQSLASDQGLAVRDRSAEQSEYAEQLSQWLGEGASRHSLSTRRSVSIRASWSKVPLV